VLVLASGSPRRRQLLDWLGIEYAIEPADLDETPRPGESAEELVRRLACAKALAVAGRRSGACVLAADTIVEIDGVLLGKPVDRAEAALMLARLAGREHRVVTGFALVEPGGTVLAQDVVLSRVRFRALDSRAISAYVASGEPEGKAGGYAVQGLGAGLIDRVEGSLTNVIGLPLTEVAQALEGAGVLAR
jgi:septum formation protein